MPLIAVVTLAKVQDGPAADRWLWQIQRSPPATFANQVRQGTWRPRKENAAEVV